MKISQKVAEVLIEERQKAAYISRNMIQIGDAFLWHFAVGYGTSGKLKKKYMRVSDETTGARVMKVAHVHEGINAYGRFVDYYLNADGIYDGDPRNCLIINGPDAFKMERVRT